MTEIKTSFMVTSKDVHLIDRFCELVREVAASQLPQRDAVRTAEQYLEENPEDMDNRDLTIATCAIMSVVNMLESVSNELKGAQDELSNR